MNARTPIPAPLAADLEAGLRRLKLATIRREAPNILATARAQRWAPEEVLRSLIEAEVIARDESNSRTRMTLARFPMTKTLDEFNLTESSIPPRSHHYLTTLEWIGNAINLCLVGPAGTGKSHYLIGLGRAAVTAGHRVRYFTAVDLVEHLYRAVADNTVGKAIEQICRNDLIIIDLCRHGDYADPSVTGVVGVSEGLCKWLVI
jgi:DNA replication protein DnaC